MNEMDLGGLSRKSLAEQVAQKLLGLIRTGNLKPGDTLPPERELAEQLGVSRPVVREALRALSTFGLIHTQHGGGSTIAAVRPESLVGPLSLCLSLSEEDLPAIIEARAAIETALLRNVARHPPEALLTALRDNIRRQRAVLNDLESCNRLTDEFRGLIMEACDNPFLLALAKSMELVAGKARALYLEAGPGLEARLERDAQVVEALASGDPERAEEALQLHFDRLLQELNDRTV